METVSPEIQAVGSSHQLSKQFHYIKVGLRSLDETMDPMTLGLSLDACLLYQLQERTWQIEGNLNDVTDDILAN